MALIAGAERRAGVPADLFSRTRISIRCVALGWSLCNYRQEPA
jgi:hypothetical protein